MSLVLAPYGSPGRAVGVVGVLGPTRMAYPQAIGTVRFVSRPHERADRPPLRLTTTPRPRDRMTHRKTRAEERIEELDVSAGRPRRRGRRRCSAERDEALAKADEYLAALQRERAEFTNFKRRTAEERERELGLAGEDLIRKVLNARRRLRPRHRQPARPTLADDAWAEGIAAIDRKLRQLLESEGVTRDRGDARHAVRPARARGDRERPGHRPRRGRDRRRDPARLPAPRPGHPARRSSPSPPRATTAPAGPIN